MSHSQKLHTPHSEVRTLWTHPVRYQWSTPDGTIHHASSVMVANSRRAIKAALSQFWITNNHVTPESL